MATHNVVCLNQCVIELQRAMNARAKMLVVVLAGSLLQLPAVWGSVEVMKDVTLGFGQALQHCREEVTTSGNCFK